MSVALHEAFDRRLLRHIEVTLERLAEADGQLIAQYAAKGLVRSGPRLKRQAQERNQHLDELVQWCLSEVLHLQGDADRNWNEHSHSIRGGLATYMSATRSSVVSGAVPFGPSVVQAIEVILDKADAGAFAELDDFGAGVWRPKSARETSVTNNSVTITNSTVGSIQQAGDGAVQQSADAQNIGSIRRALEAFERAVAEAQISEHIRSEIQHEVETLVPQMRKAAPSAVIVRESLKTLRNIVEGTAGGVLALPFAALLHAAAPMIGAS